MKNILNDETIDIPCDCGLKHKKTIKWIKSNKQIVCSCGININLESEKFRNELKKIEKSLSDLERTLNNFNK